MSPPAQPCIHQPQRHGIVAHCSVVLRRLAVAYCSTSSCSPRGCTTITTTLSCSARLTPLQASLGFRLIITFVSFTCKGVRVMVCTSATLFAHSFLNKSIGPCLLLLCDDKTDRGAALQGAARTIWRGEYSQPPENIHRSMGKGAITRWQTQ